VCIDAAGRAGVLAEGDALVDDTPGTLLGVKTADCVPLLLVDERQRAVAAVHAGWRGAVQDVAGKTVEKMAVRYHTRPEDLHAAIGPSIGGCCFEVGPEVAVQFGHAPNGKVHIDLAALHRERLLALGLAPERVYAAELCTVCGGEEFHSFRRDGQAAGRMLSVVGIVGR
jgi:YfiH family protein